MKKNVLTLMALGTAMTAMAGGDIVWLGQRHSFGVFDEDKGPVGCEFKFVNTGDEPVTIVSARASCGCTTPTYPDGPIMPGDSATIGVVYNPAGRPGRFSKSVYVETTAQQGKTKLTIDGTVIGGKESVALRYPIDKGAVQLRSAGVIFGQVVKPHLKTVFAEGYNRSTETLEMSVVKKPRIVDINFEPRTVAPGEQVTTICYLRSGEPGAYGIIEDSVLISDGRREFWLPFTANVVEDFSKMSASEREKAPRGTLSAESIDMGEFDRDSAALTGSVTIGNEGKNALEIRRVYSVDRGVSAETDRTAIKKGKTATVSVRVDPAQLQGDLLNARVMVITNDPDNPVRTIRVVGMAKR